MAKKLAEFTLNHLEFNIEDRGKWRKFNPYNPYVEDQEERPKDLKVESLDDLFDDEPTKSEKNSSNNDTNNGQNSKQENEAPILPQADETARADEDDIMSVDIQKELEAKFDELFGAFDEDDK